MRLLLDTHVVLWELAGTRTVSAEASAVLGQASEVFFSAVSCAEIGVKVAVGKLTVPGDLLDHVRRTGIRLLPLAAEHGLEVARLPLRHRDPFDRLLVAQARVERLVVVTADRRFADYGVRTIDAGSG